MRIPLQSPPAAAHDAAAGASDGLLAPHLPDFHPSQASYLGSILHCLALALLLIQLTAASNEEPATGRLVAIHVAWTIFAAFCAYLYACRRAELCYPAGKARAEASSALVAWARPMAGVLFVVGFVCGTYAIKDAPFKSPSFFLLGIFLLFTAASSALLLGAARAVRHFGELSYGAPAIRQELSPMRKLCRSCFGCSLFFMGIVLLLAGFGLALSGGLTTGCACSPDLDNAVLRHYGLYPCGCDYWTAECGRFCSIRMGGSSQSCFDRDLTTQTCASPRTSLYADTIEKTQTSLQVPGLILGLVGIAMLAQAWATLLVYTAQEIAEPLLGKQAAAADAAAATAGPDVPAAAAAAAAPAGYQRADQQPFRTPGSAPLIPSAAPGPDMSVPKAAKPLPPPPSGYSWYVDERGNVVLGPAAGASTSEPGAPPEGEGGEGDAYSPAGSGSSALRSFS